jgi:hypothetical protein
MARTVRCFFEMRRLSSFGRFATRPSAALSPASLEALAGSDDVVTAAVAKEPKRDITHSAASGSSDGCSD